MCHKWHVTKNMKGRIKLLITRLIMYAVLTVLMVALALITFIIPSHLLTKEKNQKTGVIKICVNAVKIATIIVAFAIIVAAIIAFLIPSGGLIR